MGYSLNNINSRTYYSAVVEQKRYMIYARIVRRTIERMHTFEYLIKNYYFSEFRRLVAKKNKKKNVPFK